MRWWSGVVAMLVAAGCSSDPRSCALEDVLAQSIGGIEATDCGHLSAGASGDMLQAAHDCALAQEAAFHAFVVEWDVQGIDSRVAHAFVGIGRAGEWTITHYDYDSDPSGGSMVGAVTSSQSCGQFGDLGDCGGDRPQSLCLACGSPFDAAQCR